MTDFIAALPMYDWPEVRAEVDTQWAAIRDVLRGRGVEAPERLARRNADLPTPDGASDTAMHPPDAFDLQALWRHPQLLLAQTCWGPMETTGLAEQVQLVGQPDYSAFVGGQGAMYSSAILMRRKDGEAFSHSLWNGAQIPLDRIRNKRFAFNGRDSMSGIIGLTRDLEAIGESLAMFSDLMETGGHRNSIRAVAEGMADVCAIDCRSWALAIAHEPAAQSLHAVGWTALRKGLPFITSGSTAGETVSHLRDAMVSAGMLAG